VVSFIPRSLHPPGKRLRYPLDRRLSGPQNRSARYGEDKNLIPAGNRNPGRPTRSPSLHRLSYPDSLYFLFSLILSLLLTLLIPYSLFFLSMFPSVQHPLLTTVTARFTQPSVIFSLTIITKRSEALKRLSIHIMTPSSHVGILQPPELKSDSSAGGFRAPRSRVMQSNNKQTN
jgi:hypothetical protein